MTLSIETIYKVCLPLHNEGNKVSCKQVRPVNHFCDVTIPLKFTANQIDRIYVKDLDSAVAKRGSVFIGLMTPDGAIWFRYQRAVLMR